ncbi:hypothetical protein HC766_00725 [Candidatus Gracilibacteria bacterium]|nr:hypothetical protein [Candidatus Gracilibacteria bacterium]NJS40909.1 hypothetical protein [Candidatus Gracilibacteria bacterium]
MNSKSVAVVIISLIVLVSGGLILFFNSQSNNKSTNELASSESSLVEDRISEPNKPNSSTLPNDPNNEDQSVVLQVAEDSNNDKEGSQFTDGTYKEEGTYRIPRGADEEIVVNLTLEDDIVTDLSVELFATEGQSLIHQNNFRKGFNADELIGKNLEEISLSRVTGASLSTAAFNKAISSIQSQAM